MLQHFCCLHTLPRTTIVVSVRMQVDETGRWDGATSVVKGSGSHDADTLPASTTPSPRQQPTVALLFDASLVGVFMMGNLSQSLKGHAVTMFEVGRLSSEAVDHFLEELCNVRRVVVMRQRSRFSLVLVQVNAPAAFEGDAEGFFIRAMCTKNTLQAMRMADRGEVAAPHHGGGGSDSDAGAGDGAGAGAGVGAGAGASAGDATSVTPQPVAVEMVRCGSLNNLTASVRFAYARDMSPCLLLCWPHCMQCRPPPSPRLKLLQSHKAIIPLGLPPASCSGVANVLRSCPLGERPAFLGCNGPLLRPPWFPLFLYSQLGCGPVSLLVPRGCIITDLPDVLKVRCPQPTVYRRQSLAEAFEPSSLGGACICPYSET